ncbi:MAG: serine hydrolase, partial [Bacteroidota bacterium]
VTITNLENPKATMVLSNEKELFREAFALKDTLAIQLDDKLRVEGILNNETDEVNGFVKLNIDFYPIQLQKKGNHYEGKFNLAANNYLQSQSLYLEIRKLDGPEEAFTAYPLLGTFWVNDLTLENNTIAFKDYKTGLLFEGELKKSQIALNVRIGTTDLCKIAYSRVDKKPKVKVVEKATDWSYTKEPLALSQLENDIESNTLKGVESVLVAQDGKIYYENYFRGTTNSSTNDLRSAAKSIGSAIIGIAIADGIMTSPQEKVYDYIPKAYQYTKDEQKRNITIEHLLTMSSGIGVYEDDYQESADWLKTVLEPELTYKAGTHTNYRSADPFLLSVNLSERLVYPLEYYMHQKLFAPLGIDDYILNTDDKGNPYFGGGLCLRPIDMLKFGQLYLNKGTWLGERVLSEEWVNTSLAKHTKLENTSKKNAYGYFWWHDTYTVNGKAISAIEARGNGGQYISIIPELNAVIVVATENYNKRGAAEQTEKIIQGYVLPKLIKK